MMCDVMIGWQGHGDWQEGHFGSRPKENYIIQGNTFVECQAFQIVPMSSALLRNWHGMQSMARGLWGGGIQWIWDIPYITISTVFYWKCHGNWNYNSNKRAKHGGSRSYNSRHRACALPLCTACWRNERERWWKISIATLRSYHLQGGPTGFHT